MTTSSTPLSPQQMQEINGQALAAVQRGREMLTRARQQREKLGLTPQKLQQLFDSAPPGSRAWIHTAVTAGLAVAGGSKPQANPSARARRPRSLV